MGTGFGTLKLFGKAFSIQANGKIGNMRRFLSKDLTGISAVATPIGGKANKYTQKIANGLAKGVVLSKTAGFFPAMAVTALVAGGIGYLLSNVGKKDDDMGLVIEREEPVELPPPIEPETIEVPNYHTIKSSGYTWEDIVRAYYPGLIEQCDNKIYGSDGAIRKLKLALSECGSDLVNESDIPKTLNLPLEIDGVKLNKDGVLVNNSKLEKGGSTSIEEAGCKNTKAVEVESQDEKLNRMRKAIADINSTRTFTEQQLNIAS